MRNLVLAATTFALAAALPAAAQSRIEPAQPTAFERVNLRMTVDSCAFEPATVHVHAAGDNTIQVTQRPNQCLVPGEPRVVDVRLGSLPAGLYRVEIHATPEPRDPVETLSFEVVEPAEAAVFPPPPRPLADYTGLWWNPAESGWGISLHQSPVHALFGAWFVYDAEGDPQWFTLQGGRWTSSTTWEGFVFRTTGPYFAGPDYDPRLVLVLPAGTATLDFAHRPGEEDVARFTYTVNGITTTKQIRRMAF